MVMDSICKGSNGCAREWVAIDMAISKIEPSSIFLQGTEENHRMNCFTDDDKCSKNTSSEKLSPPLPSQVEENWV